MDLEVSEISKDIGGLFLGFILGFRFSFIDEFLFSLESYEIIFFIRVDYNGVLLVFSFSVFRR